MHLDLLSWGIDRGWHGHAGSNRQLIDFYLVFDVLPSEDPIADFSWKGVFAAFLLYLDMFGTDGEYRLARFLGLARDL